VGTEIRKGGKVTKAVPKIAGVWAEQSPFDEGGGFSPVIQLVAKNQMKIQRIILHYQKEKQH